MNPLTMTGQHTDIFPQYVSPLILGASFSIFVLCTIMMRLYLPMTFGWTRGQTALKALSCNRSSTALYYCRGLEEILYSPVLSSRTCRGKSCFPACLPFSLAGGLGKGLLWADGKRNQLKCLEMPKEDIAFI